MVRDGSIDKTLELVLNELSCRLQKVLKQIQTDRDLKRLYVNKNVEWVQINTEFSVGSTR